MCSRIGSSIVRMVTAFMVIFSIITPATSRSGDRSSILAIQPNRCIALQQGQTCFATLNFNWTTPATGNFCLFDERQREPLLCWSGNTVTTYTLKFASAVNVKYELRLESGNTPLAQTMIKVSWVYKSNNASTSRWRMF